MQFLVLYLTIKVSKICWLHFKIHKSNHFSPISTATNLVQTTLPSPVEYYNLAGCYRPNCASLLIPTFLECDTFDHMIFKNDIWMALTQVDQCSNKRGGCSELAKMHTQRVKTVRARGERSCVLQANHQYT